MVAKESVLPPDKRIDFVSIVTPNVYHFEAAKLCLEAGFHVVCDKPMTCSLAEAKALKSIVDKIQGFCANHTYTGYPMVKQARFLVQAGCAGKINKIVVEYPQGWLSGFLGSGVTAATMWRTDPQKAGVSLCMGDIGIHAENLGRYITGLEIENVCADILILSPAINWMMMPISWCAIRTGSRGDYRFPNFYRRRKWTQYPGFTAPKRAY